LKQIAPNNKYLLLNSHRKNIGPSILEGFKFANIEAQLKITTKQKHNISKICNVGLNSEDQET
jgi:hypothetical protein